MKILWIFCHTGGVVSRRKGKEFIYPYRSSLWKEKVIKYSEEGGDRLLSEHKCNLDVAAFMMTTICRWIVITCGGAKSR